MRPSSAPASDVCYGRCVCGKLIVPSRKQARSLIRKLRGHNRVVYPYRCPYTGYLHLTRQHQRRTA